MIETEREKRIGPIGERLRELMRHYSLNMNRFSVKLGLSSNSVITRVVNDPERGISLDYIQTILLTFPEINARWLVLGEGEMLINNDLTSLQNKPERSEGPCLHCAQKDSLITNLEKDKNDLRANILDLRCSVENLREIAGLQKKVAG